MHQPELWFSQWEILRGCFTITIKPIKTLVLASLVYQK